MHTYNYKSTNTRYIYNYTITDNYVIYNYESTNTRVYLQLYVFITCLVFSNYSFTFTTIYMITNMIN